MSILNKFDLTKIINARGTFTPLGVSRSSNGVTAAVSQALSNYYVMDELQDVVSNVVASFAGSQAATVTHCSASSITLSVAATMTGTNVQHIASLPDIAGMPNEVVIPAGHCVNYGHPIVQAIRLTGAKPVLAGTKAQCTLQDIEHQISSNKTCCLLLVSSKLVQSPSIDFKKAVEIAHSHDIPVVIDGAAQDFRIPQLLSSGADLLLISGQKYLNSPTAGIVIGNKVLIDAVRAQEKGIGRGMKATKEAIIGVLAAIEEREKLNVSQWSQAQDHKTLNFVEHANAIPGVKARVENDATGLPFSRAILSINDEATALNAQALANQLKAGTPSIWVIDQNADKGEIGFELVHVEDKEIEIILSRLSNLLNENRSTD